MFSHLNKFTVALMPLFVVGCASNPLHGWYGVSPSFYQPDKAITDDYQKFMKELPAASPGVDLYEDRKGGHAVEIYVFGRYSGHETHYLLEYDKFDKRIRVRKWSRANDWI